MKIMHLIYSGGFYGAEAVILNLCIGQKKKGYKPIIACLHNHGTEKPLLGIKAEALSIKVYYIESRNKVDPNPIATLRNISKIEKIGFIHSHGYKASIFCLLLYILFRIPYVITCHLWTRETFRYHFYVLMERISMIFAKKVVSVSKSIRDEICRWPFLRYKVSVINNGINIDEYTTFDSTMDSKQVKIDLGIHPDKIVIGTLGRLSVQKGHSYLLKAASKLIKQGYFIDIVIAGEGKLRGKLETLAIELGIMDRVHLIGFRDDAINVLNIFDIFILPSINEGLPIVLLEAMFLRKPIIVTSVGEVPYVVSDGKDAVMISPKSTSQIENALLKVLKDKDFREQLSKEAYVTAVSRYSLSMMTNSYLKIYSSI